VLGVVPSHLLATACIAAALAVALALGDTVGTICAAIGLPFYVMYTCVRKTWAMEATYKVGGAAVMLAAAAHCAAFAVVALTVVLCTRIYFRRRFGVGYPSLLPAAHVS
jgi:hypothetical protein